MAQRRMFSLKVVDTDSFLDMSPTAQNLYFHLGMRADDDGFLANPKRIQKMIGAPDDDIKVLIAKNFIIPMATNGVCVVTHWKVNNLIKGDRYTPTLYLEEKDRLVEENGIYKVDILGSKMVPQPEPQVRLGKDREVHTSGAIAPQIVEVSEISEESRKPSAKPKYPHALEVFALWGAYPKNWTSMKNSVQREAAENLYQERGIQAIKDAVEWYETVKHLPFCPQMTSPHDLDSKWDKLDAFSEKHHD